MVETRILLFLLRFARFLTVVGPNQREKLLALGAPPSKVVILPNSVEMVPLSIEALREKHASGTQTMTVLFLSNLIPSKGFLEFVEAIYFLSKDPMCPPLKAVLCGSMLASEFAATTLSELQCRTIIEKRMLEINASGSHSLEWIPGAYREEKVALFKKSHIFVLPTTYAVEAQPLVLLEAMSSGAAIITSAAGEIPWTVGEAAVILPRPDAFNISEAIKQLAIDHASRLSLAENGLSLFCSRFSLRRHQEAWEWLISDGTIPANDSVAYSGANP